MTKLIRFLPEILPAQTLRKFLQTVLLLFLSGCVASQENSVALSPTLETLNDEHNGLAVNAFASLCITPSETFTERTSDAIGTGWREAGDEDLAKSNLTRLRRQILEIPGGGGRYRETQNLMILENTDYPLIANLMERFHRAGNKLVRTDCAIYTSSDNHLETCATLGRLIGRPPDSNTKFKHSGNHFVRWNTVLSKQQSSVRCDLIGSTDNENVFAGTRLIAIVDHSTDAKVSRTAARIAKIDELSDR